MLTKQEFEEELQELTEKENETAALNLVTTVIVGMLLMIGVALSATGCSSSRDIRTTSWHCSDRETTWSRCSEVSK